MKQQHTLMRFDPATGKERPYPSHAEQYRKYHGQLAWLINPWSGIKRDAGDIGTDVFGHLIIPPGEPIYAEPRIKSNPSIKGMVDRFLGWTLPSDFNPDGGIRFTAVMPSWPIGTHLFTADQATEMFEYCLTFEKEKQ